MTRAYIGIGSNEGDRRSSIDRALAALGETARVAVRARATQRMDGRIVVFVRHGETYEARPLKLGRRSTEWVEVLDGLEPGAEYVVDGAFLIRADVEKAGAGHEH